MVQQGVEQFCIAPGSRNSPLILAAAEHPKAKTVVHFDERGLGFYALGYGKGAKKPAAVIVTSGTAVGHLLPSIMEAHLSSIPLLLLTADRPFELKECGANQACDQVKIFSSYLRWEIDIPPHQEETSLRSVAAQGVFHTLANPPGPVQINCQFREPFVFDSLSPTEKNVSFSLPKLSSSSTRIHASRGLILIGSIDSDVRPILKLAKRLQWPVLADILSNARSYVTEEQITHFDPILTPKPDFILHFGSRLTSKKALSWPAHMHVSSLPHLQDPMRQITSRVQSDIEPFCEQFEANSDPSWLTMWKEKEALIKQQFSQKFAAFSDFTESHLMRHLSSLISSEHAVFLGSGMPIREADLFLFPKKTKGFFSNRGLSGIDGNIATAAGLVQALQTPVIAILGDQTCLHDLNSLPLLKKTSHPLILIISNNFGGGIFSHLPIASSSHFETHIAAQHSWHFQKAAEMFEIPYADSLEGLDFSASCIVEIVTSRIKNHAFHQ